jgi:hypothetical protein
MRNTGTFATGLSTAFADQARFSLQGTAFVENLPRVVNEGLFTGSFQLGAVRFDNATGGVVSVGADEGLAIALGEHAGSFLGTVGSSLVFGGSSFSNNRFLAGSSIASGGAVLFARGAHFMHGNYDVPTLTVGPGGVAEFSGSVSALDRLEVQGETPFHSGGRVEFKSSVNAGGTTSIDEVVAGDFSLVNLSPGGDLVIDSLTGTRASFLFFGTGKTQIATALLDRGGATFATGQTSTIGSLDLLDGFLTANQRLEITDSFVWAGGTLAGSSRVVAKRALDIAPGAQATSLFGGTLENQDNGRWRTSIGNWSGKLINAAGATLTLEGAFNATEPTGGAPLGAGFYNEGSFHKNLGATADLGVAVFNSGLIDVDAGTLVLSGGGELRQGSFLDAAPGTRIELRAPGSREWVVDEDLRTRSTGRVEFLGGDVHFKLRGRETVAAGESFLAEDLRLDAGAQLRADASAIFDVDSVFNEGLLEIRTQTASAGSYRSSASGELDVDTNSFLSVSGGPGSEFDASGAIRNRGNLSIATDTASLRGMIANGGSMSTSGFTRLQGARYTGTSGSVLSNSGLLVFEQGVRADIGAGGVLESLGATPGAFAGNTLGAAFDDGGLLIEAGATVEGAGLFRQIGGYTKVNGRLATAGGVEIAGGKLRGTGVIDLLNSGIPLTIGAGSSVSPGNSPGTLTVLGDLEVAANPLFTPGSQLVPGLGGALEFEFGANAYSGLDVSGQVRLGAGSEIKLEFASGIRPVEGREYRFLRAGGGIIDEGASPYFNLPAGWSAEWGGFLGSVVFYNPDAVELIPLIVDSNGLQRADLPSGGVVRHVGDATIDEQIARLDLLVNAGQFHNAYAEIQPTYLSTPGNPNGILEIQNLVGGSFVNRGEISHVSSDGFGNRISNDGRFENGPGAGLSAGLITNRGEFVNGGLIERQGAQGFFAFEPRSTLLNLSDGHFVNERGGEIRAALVVNENRGDFEQAGRLELRAGVSEGPSVGPTVGAVINRGEFRVSGEVEVLPNTGPFPVPPFVIRNTGFDDDNNSFFYDPSTGDLLPGPGGAPQGPVRFDIAAGGRVTGANFFEQSAYHREVALHVDGLLEVSDAIAINGGSLSGAGILRAPDVSISGAAVGPGNSPGTLTIDGDLVLNFSEIFIEYESPAVFDRLEVTGRATLSSNSLTLSLGQGVLPVAGLAFDWLTADGGVVNDGNPFIYWVIQQADEYGGYVMLADSFGYRDASLAGLVIDLSAGSFGVSAVPLPPSALLLAGGLLPLVLRVRRRAA